MFALAVSHSGVDREVTSHMKLERIRYISGKLATGALMEERAQMRGSCSAKKRFDRPKYMSVKKIGSRGVRVIERTFIAFLQIRKSSKEKRLAHPHATGLCSEDKQFLGMDAQMDNPVDSLADELTSAS